MANVLHSALTGGDLHESKGAASAASGTVAIANGAGNAVFGVLSYAQLSNTPLPKLQLNGTDSTGQAKIKVYTTTSNASGVWSVTLSGFTTIWGVFTTTFSNGSELGSLTAVKTVSPTSVTGTTIQYTNTTNSVLATAPVQVLVIGV